MKRKFFTLILLVSSIVCFSQKETPLPPYQRFPEFPPVKLLLADSSYFTKESLEKKWPVLLMLFNPKCEHCQHETEEIIQHIDEFKNIRIVMATTQPFDSMKAFIQKYQLTRFSNITVGQDLQFFLPSFFQISNLPLIALYDKKKKLLKATEGSAPITAILEMLKEK
jgi:peroxiredoxin